MAKFKAMKSFRVGETGIHVRPGDTFDVSDATGSIYETRGMATKIAAGATVGAATKKNEASEAGPLRSTGGATGAAKRVSSSRRGKAPKRRASKK